MNKQLNIAVRNWIAVEAWNKDNFKHVADAITEQYNDDTLEQLHTDMKALRDTLPPLRNIDNKEWYASKKRIVKTWATDSDVRKTLVDVILKRLFIGRKHPVKFAYHHTALLVAHIEYVMKGESVRGANRERLFSPDYDPKMKQPTYIYGHDCWD